MSTIIGRGLGLVLSFVVFVSGVWVALNSDSAVIVVIGVTTVVVGIVMVGSVANKICEDLDKWDREQ